METATHLSFMMPDRWKLFGMRISFLFRRESRPASLSRQVHQILREELGFDGVIITDDLSMDGIRQFTGDEEAAVLAVKAGNDLLCCTDFQIQVPAVLQAVESGEIDETRIDESVLRILRLKASLGLISPYG